MQLHTQSSRMHVPPEWGKNISGHKIQPGPTRLMCSWSFHVMFNLSAATHSRSQRLWFTEKAPKKILRQGPNSSAT